MTPCIQDIGPRSAKLDLLESLIPWDLAATVPEVSMKTGYREKQAIVISAYVAHELQQWFTHIFVGNQKLSNGT